MILGLKATFSPHRRTLRLVAVRDLRWDLGPERVRLYTAHNEGLAGNPASITPGFSALSEAPPITRREHMSDWFTSTLNSNRFAHFKQRGNYGLRPVFLTTLLSTSFTLTSSRPS